MKDLHVLNIGWILHIKYVRMDVAYGLHFNVDLDICTVEKPELVGF